jgi:hypothetical protein
MAKYYNTSKIKGPSLKEGDKVYLLRKHIKTKRLSDKLDHKKLGPFKIRKVVSSSNYELQLPSTIRIHPIFHILLLELVPDSVKLTKPVEVDTIEGE